MSAQGWDSVCQLEHRGGLSSLLLLTGLDTQCEVLQVTGFCSKLWKVIMEEKCIQALSGNAA